MTNHLHLVLETPDADLSSGMQWLHGAYGQAFNRRHGRRGHLFEGRYGATRARSDEQVCVAAGYVARNPVDAGLCRRPEDWPWSSFRETVQPGIAEWVDADRLLSFFAMNQLTARRLYDYRTVNGPLKRREQLKEVPGFGEATYVQAAGFLKITGGDQPLDVLGVQLRNEAAEHVGV